MYKRQCLFLGIRYCLLCIFGYVFVWWVKFVYDFVYEIKKSACIFNGTSVYSIKYGTNDVHYIMCA